MSSAGCDYQEEIAQHPALHQLDIGEEQDRKEEYKYDQLYLSNYATSNIKDGWPASPVSATSRSSARATTVCGSGWIPRSWPPADLTAGDVTAAIRDQNKQVAAGRLGQPPSPRRAENFQLTLEHPGRLDAPSNSAPWWSRPRLGSRPTSETWSHDPRPEQKGVELGAKNYDVNSYLDGDPPSPWPFSSCPAPMP